MRSGFVLMVGLKELFSNRVGGFNIMLTPVSTGGPFGFQAPPAINRYGWYFPWSRGQYVLRDERELVNPSETIPKLDRILMIRVINWPITCSKSDPCQTVDL